MATKTRTETASGRKPTKAELLDGQAHKANDRAVGFWGQTKQSQELAPKDGETRLMRLIDTETGEVVDVNVEFGEARPNTQPWYTSDELKVGVFFRYMERNIRNSVFGEFPVLVVIDLQSGEAREIAESYALKDIFTAKHENLDFYIREIDSTQTDAGRTLRNYEVRPINVYRK